MQTLLEEFSPVISESTRQGAERYKSQSGESSIEGEMSKKREYKVVSLFSGCGGLDLGFVGGFNFLGTQYASNPFKVIFANDIMPSAVETHNHNFKENSCVCEDIKKLLDTNQFEISNADVVLGGFPCQDFSLAGNRKGFDTERGKLYWQMKKVIELTKPKVFIAENVKGLVLMPGALEKIKADFSKIMPAYAIQHKVLTAADFGVPQLRERVIIVGVRKDLKAQFKYPDPTHAKVATKKLLPWISAHAALSDLTDKHPNQTQISKAKNYGVHLQGNKAIEKNQPSPTIRAEHHGNIEFHYSNKR